MVERRSQDHYRGCLLGGAVGDAMGAAVEFMGLEEIRRTFGPSGITEPAEAYGRTGAVTDDTQMTLFSAEALIRGHNRWLGRGIASVVRVGHRAYLRWLHTQTGGLPEDLLDGWLVRVEGLHHSRSPGGTCIAALASGRAGTMERPLNDSKGCGGVMRAAPAGLAGVDDSFAAGCELAAITHGHPTGYLAAGLFAHIVRCLADGSNLGDAISRGLERREARPGHEETLRAVEQAVELAATPGPAERVESLGQGWVAEEALAIGLYCALVAKDFASGVLLAVNHGGDSDSTGSIAGQIVGAIRGEEAIPARWLERLELREVIAGVADALWQEAAPAYLSGRP